MGNKISSEESLYLRKRVQISAVSKKPSAGKCCRLNRNPIEGHSVLKNWLFRNWIVRFKNLSFRAGLKLGGNQRDMDLIFLGKTITEESGSPGGIGNFSKRCRNLN